MGTSIFLEALALRPTLRRPVWIMRQAGRYLPEYRALRARAGDFLTLCKTPDWAAEATLQPLARYDLDAAIIFSDILTVPDSLGLGLGFREGEGPFFQQPIERGEDIDRLCDRFEQAGELQDCVERLGYVSRAIRLVCASLQGRTPLIGFCGSPWTVARYMFKDPVKNWIGADPVRLTRFLSLLTELSIAYLREQVAAGVEALMIFDTWGGDCTWYDYPIYSLAYMHKMVEAFAGSGIPVILFSKGTSFMLPQLARTGCAGIGVDWTCSLAQARRLIMQAGRQKQALQGNLDPAVLRAPDSVIRARVEQVCSDYGAGPGHIFNLGHGITPDIDPDKVHVLLEALRAWQPVGGESSLAYEGGDHDSCLSGDF